MSTPALALRLDQIDLANPDTFVAGWPHDAFALLRREAPVYWHPGGGAAGGFWVVSKYRDVMAAQLDSKTFSSARGGTILREFEGEELEANRAIMLNMDAPRHTRFRRLVNLGFSPKIVNRMALHIRDIARNIVDAVAARGTCDFVADIAAELPLQVIAEMVGVPTEDRDRLLREPTLLSTTIEEMLRWASPVMYFRRAATRDTELRGQQIREGDKVTLWYGSANRDEDEFPEADRFDVGRTPNEHLAFGIGHHFCLGANLARLEIQIMFEELLRRLPDIELDGKVERLRSNFINGIKRMPVRFTPERS